MTDLVKIALISGLVSVSAGAALAGDGASSDAMFYGISHAGENDGLSGPGTALFGKSSVDFQGKAWTLVEHGDCASTRLLDFADGTPRFGSLTPLTRDLPPQDGADLHRCVPTPGAAPPEVRGRSAGHGSAGTGSVHDEARLPKDGCEMLHHPTGLHRTPLRQGRVGGRPGPLASDGRGRPSRPPPPHGRRAQRAGAFGTEMEVGHGTSVCRLPEYPLGGGEASGG